VRGLDSGADDYLVKPFAYPELAARLRALSRRTTGDLGELNVIENGPIRLDEAKRIVTVGGRQLTLSPREFSLLECFLRHPGQVLTRDQLLDAAWPLAAVTPTTTRAPPPARSWGSGTRVLTERGVGYRMAEA
jgi:DNA-binding response OmpR family regulator